MALAIASGDDSYFQAASDSSLRNILLMKVKAMNGDSSSCMRLSTLVLVATLALFYNAEIFLPDTLGSTTYHVMYLFGTLAAGSALIIPALSSFPLYLASAFWGLAYMLAVPHFTSGYSLHIMLSGTNLIHVVMVAGITTLTHWYARKLDAYSHNERRPIDYASPPPLLDDELENIKYEITRARRYNRPISVIMLQPIAKSYGTMDKGTLSKTLSRIFRRTERLYDMGKHGRFLIFSPETTNSSAEMLVNRIRIMVHREQDMHFNYGIATFPDQELTFDGLVSRAEENLETGASHKTASIKAIKDGKLMVNR